MCAYSTSIWIPLIGYNDDHAVDPPRNNGQRVKQPDTAIETVDYCQSTPPLIPSSTSDVTQFASLVKGLIQYMVAHHVPYLLGWDGR